ncbi:MAG: 16S rRNA (adenine(1518)-N(6)/adenine(1519)-N(6))-dimethyltransferase RsmA [Vicinamibacterales bacterium]
MTSSRPPRARPLRSGRDPHRPSKRLGQHFLAASWAERIVQAVNPQPGDVFLEIGPGTGALTLPLAATGVPVLAVEIDRSLVADLVQRVAPNVTVVTGDILSTDVLAYLSGLEPQRPPGRVDAPAPPRRFRVIGNLPYYIASPILFRLIDFRRSGHAFADATVMLQREVADRLLAKPGSKTYGVLTVMMTMHATIRRVLDLPPGAFSPKPRVSSSVVSLTFGPPAARVGDEALFERMVKAMFGQRRKTLNNALKGFDPSAAAILVEAGIEGRRRPETLQLLEIARLAELFAAARRAAVL